MVVSPAMIYNASAKGIRIDEVESILECDPDVQGSWDWTKMLETDIKRLMLHSE